MICAVTARRITEGRADEFIEAFSNGPKHLPAEIAEHFTAVYACRDVNDPNLILTFGLFDGELEQLRSAQSSGARDEQLAAIEPLVEETVFDHSFEVVRELISEASPAR